MTDKAAYVRRQGQDRNHTCHWPGCETQVPPAMWGCRPHWFRLPKRLRDAIWDAYVPGQERRCDPSAEYLAVAREVQDWIAAHSAPAHSGGGQQGLGAAPSDSAPADRPTEPRPKAFGDDGGGTAQ